MSNINVRQYNLVEHICKNNKKKIDKYDLNLFCHLFFDINQKNYLFSFSFIDTLFLIIDLLFSFFFFKLKLRTSVLNENKLNTETKTKK